VARQLYTVLVSISKNLFQAERSLFPLFLLSFYGKLAVSVQITLPFVLLSSDKRFFSHFTKCIKYTNWRTMNGE
jgi:hypothetical protein